MLAFPVSLDYFPQQTGHICTLNTTYRKADICDLFWNPVIWQKHARLIQLNHLLWFWNNMNEIIPSYGEPSLKEEFSDLYNECVEQPADIVKLNENKERSTTTTTCYDVMQGSNKAGEFQKFSPTARTMFMTSKRSYGHFETVSWGEFPDEKSITADIQGKDPTRTVSIIFPGPTYENANLITWLAVDNGESAWQSINITDPTVANKWMIYIIDGKIHFSHTTEVTQEYVNQLIREQRDLCTLPSIKRPWKDINSSLLWTIWKKTTHRRFLVQMQDWSSGVLTLQNRNAEQVENILSDSKFSRVLYCDGLWSTWQMDGWWKEAGTTRQLEYEHHVNGRKTQEVKWNMPAIFVVYNQPVK